jgi:hypothetical protein
VDDRGRADSVGPEEKALLRAAGLQDKDQAERAFAAYRASVPEGREQRPARRLLPAVARNLARLGARRDPFLLRAYAESFGANARLLRSAGDVLRVLHEADIPALVLKGVALLVVHYRDLGARPMSDVDILVPEASVSRALDVLEAADWRGDPARAWLRSGMHAGVLSNGGGASLDLHRHGLYEARYAAADEAFFASSIPVEAGGAPARAMAADDQLIHTIVHGLRWSIAPSSIWILDAITITRNGDLDPERVRGRAAALGLTLPLRRGLELTREVLGPDEALDALIVPLMRQRDSLAARAEDFFRVREPAGLFGALPNLWFAHRRSAAPGRLGLVGFPTFLARAWGLKSPSELPRVLLRKLLHTRPARR